MKLAIEGGTPIRKTFLSYGKQEIDDSDIKAVAEVLRSDYLTTGPQVENFEKKIAEYVGAKYAVAVSNGTAALHTACHAAGIEAGDEVITSPITFAASANCVLYCGGKPIFADINSRTYNIEPLEIQKLITKKTKAIIPVDFTGQVADYEKIFEIAEKHNLITIEDAAHSLGSEYKGKRVGALADMTVFSFHPVKPITTGEGGMIVTNNEEFYNRMRLFRNHGITRDVLNLKLKDVGTWYYEETVLGYNYRITDLQCALGISQLNKIDSFIKKRKAIVTKYNEAFKKLTEIVTPFEEEYSNSGWHLYVIKLNISRLKGTREDIYMALKAENIGVNVHYIPVYLHPYYQSLGYKKGLCKNAEDLYKQVITLPLFPAMNDQDINDVINGVKKVIEYYKK